MAARKIENITIAVPHAEEKPEEIRVRILIPAKEEDDNPGLNIDKYEHVTISNEAGEQTIYVKRGEYVDVTIPVFMQLRNRYPKL